MANNKKRTGSNDPKPSEKKHKIDDTENKIKTALKDVHDTRTLVNKFVKLIEQNMPEEYSETEKFLNDSLTAFKNVYHNKPFYSGVTDTLVGSIEQSDVLGEIIDADSCLRLLD